MNDGILCRGTQHKHTIDLKKVVPVVSLIVSINIISENNNNQNFHYSIGIKACKVYGLFVLMIVLL